MDWLEKFFDMATGGLPSAAAALCPEHLKRQWLARLSDRNPFAAISANHDLVRATRLAWIEAAQAVLDEVRKLGRQHEWRGVAGEIERFHGIVADAMFDARNLALDRRKDPGSSPIDSDVDAIINGVSEFVAPARDPGLGHSVTSGFAGVLAHLSGWPLHEVPAVFAQVAEQGLPTPGNGPRRPFGVLVFAAFAEIIKDPRSYPQAREAFYVAMDKLARDLGQATIAAVKGQDERLDSVIARLDVLSAMRDGAARYLDLLPRMAAQVGETHTDVKELLALARQGGLFQRAAEQGISETAVRAIVERLGGEGIGRDDLIPWLENWIEAARERLGTATNEGEGFEVARKEAGRHFRAGRLKEASGAFMDELAREESREREHQDERKRKRLRLLEEAIRFDELAFDGDAAAAKLRTMAEIEGVVGADALGGWLLRKAVEFCERGDQNGDSAALVVAIAIGRAALKEFARERVPPSWAMTQNFLGLALKILGERESGIIRLKEAVAACEQALEECTRERAPFGWATIKNNLGNALQALGERERGPDRLEAAVAAYRDVLKEHTRERVPRAWAMTQNNLGCALKTLGEREIGIGRLVEAVTAFRAALEERTRERIPLDWAMTQNNLGNALTRLGERESGTERLREAVAAYYEALEERTRKHVPLAWAMTKNNLGIALQVLGERESGDGRLREAVEVYREALEERTRERVPLAWAATQNNLGLVLNTLGQRESGTDRLVEAVTAYREALMERTRKRDPFAWAMTQTNLGNALLTLGERESGTVRLEEAVSAYQAALEEYTQDSTPWHFGLVQDNLARTIRLLEERQSSGTA